MVLNDLKLCIDEQQWQNVINIVKADASIARKRYYLPAFANEWKNGSEVYPIHHACSMMDVPLDLIKALLYACPASIEKTESSLLRSCLHISILKGLPDHIILYLIDAFPNAAQAQDKFGRVPLHYACSNLRSYDVIQKITTAFPQCVRAPDWKMWTPLHVAVTKNTSPDIIEFMLSSCPEAVYSTTGKGHNLLNLVLDSSDVQFDNRKKILEIVQKMDAKLDKLPASQNLRNASLRPPTPLNEYSFV
jgi:hypothetical protein